MSTSGNSKKLNKWLYIAIAAVVVVAVVVAAILLWPKEEAAVSGPEAGMYYYEAETGDYLLSLMDGCKFSMWLGTDSRVGDYTVTGEAISFTFNGEEEAGATAVLKDGVLTLNYKNSEMRFLKKITYTMTFNSNGGSAVEKVSVINGKKAEKPSDPTKAGNVFLGWYADEQLTKAYNFLTDMVTSDVTVYARWAQKPEGQAEYNVNFDLGYEAEAMETMTTIGGKLYDVAAPERAGYTFGGWWISIYQDAERLSYLYEEDMVFNANTTLYATWISTETSSKLPAPQVSVNASGARWPAVSGAGSYEVTVTNAVTNKEWTRNETGTVCDIPFEGMEAGDYIVTVKAKATVESNDSVVTVRYYKNKGLDRVSVFTVVDPSVILFNAVENATGYFISVVCGNEEHNHSYFYNGNSTNFNFSSCTMPNEGIRFTVTATAEGYASSVSETFVYRRVLDAVTGLKVDDATQTVAWNPVANAAGYIITVTDANGEHEIRTNGLSVNLENYAAGENGIAVSVVPVTNGYISPAAATTTYNKTKLATPTILGIDDTVLFWTEVPGATSYVVKIGNQDFPVEGTSYDFAERLDIEQKDYTFSVKAVSDSSESTYSKALTAYYYMMNTELTYSNSTVSWYPVIGAGYYMVQVNDEYAQRVDGSKHSFEITLTQPGENIITVTNNVTEDKAVIKVFAYTVELDSRAGTAMKPVYVAMGDKINFGTPDRTGYDFVDWYTTPGGPAGNGAAYTDLVFNGTGDMMLFAHWAPKSFKVTFAGNDFEAIEDIKIKYDSTYTLPVPVSSDKTKMFAGWWTGAGGNLQQLTDADGNSVGPFTYVTDQTVYPYWATNVLQFKENPDGESYAVSAGKNIEEVSKVYIPEEHEGKPVTLVEAQGFAFSYYLREISIPNTVTLIGAGAFNGCSRLENIEIYEVDGDHEVFYWSHDGGVVYNDEASGGVKYLQFFPRAKTGSYTIPDDVQNIAINVFQQSKISEVIIPASVSVIGAGAFRNAAKLEIVRFEFAGNTTGTLEIDETAFNGCTAIREFYLPAQGSAVPVDMFRSMNALEKIEVEEGNITYSSVEGMLCDADAVSKTLLLAPKGKGGIVTIPTDIHKIAENAFAGNTGILRVSIPNHVSSIGAGAFSGCTGLLNVIFEGTRYNPLEIGDNAFANLRNLKSVEFQPTATGRLDPGAVTIGANAFANNAKLASLTIGAGVNIAYVGDHAFANNGRLGKVTISDTAAVTEIGAYAFSGNTALREVVIHASTTAIGSYAYSGCSYITAVSFADGGQEVAFGSNVFEDCERLATINIPANVTSFDGSAFTGCNNITTITVDPNNQYLTAENGVLYDKAKTTMMYYPKAREIDFAKDLPATLTTFGPAVFQDNQKITDVIIPAGVTNIGDYAFQNCINLQSVTFEDPNAAITFGKYAFANCGKLTAITIPAKTTAIGDGLFAHTFIAAITIPETVTYIGAHAFEYTYITEITIPAATTYVGSSAFEKCQNLTTVIFAAGGEQPLTLGTAGMTTSIFNGSDAVESAIELPARTTTVNAYAFYGCEAPISFAEGIQIATIGDYAFNGANVQTADVKLSNIVTIGKFAFYGTSLNSMELGNQLTDILFQGLANAGLTSVTFAEGNDDVKLNISDFAFAYNNLVTIDLPLRTSNIGTNEDTFYTVFYGMGVPVIDAADLKITEEAESYVVKSEKLAYKGWDHDKKSSTPYALWTSTLTAINIDKDNQFFGSDDGVVYRKDGEGNMSVLVYAPRGKTGSYTVPLGTTLVVNRAFNATALTEIIFADYEPGTDGYANPSLIVGTMIDDDNVNSYEEDVTIGSSALLQTIRFPSTLKSLGMYAVGYTKQLSTLTFKEDGAPLSVGPLAITSINNYNRTYNSNTLTYNYNPNTGKNQYDVGDMIVIEELRLPPIYEMAVTTRYSNAWNFRYNNIKRIIFGKGTTLETIPSYSFYQGMWESITIPASVKSIEGNVFGYNYCLKEVIFEEGSQCTYIGGSAFGNCDSLTAFTFPEYVDSFGYNVFSNCKNLTTVTLGKSISSLCGLNGSNPSFMFPSSVVNFIVSEDNEYFTVVDGVVFSKDMMTLVYYPENKPDEDLITNPELIEAWKNLRNISHFGLYKYQGNIEMPENLEYIGYSAFFGNNLLTSVTIPANVKKIETSAFANCKALTSLTFAEGSILEYIGYSAFSGTKISEVTLPASLKTIESYAFSNAGLKKMVLPEGITTIGNLFFSNMTSIEEVVLPSTLESIGYRAFDGTKIKHITIPANVKAIHYWAFANCKQLETVTFEEGSKLRTVGQRAFMNCTALKEIIFPDSVTEFTQSNTDPWSSSGDYAGLSGHTFQGCTALERVVLPNALEYIPAGMFLGCTNLKTVQMPVELTSINLKAFQNCQKLESIEISASVRSIGNYAFDGCAGLMAVNIAEGSALEYLGEAGVVAATFRGTVSLQSFEMPDGIIETGTSLFEGSGIRQIRLSGSLEMIENSTFKNCVNLQTVVLPATVLTINDEAFAGCTAMTEMDITTGVEIIGNNAFNGCTSLTKVVLPDTIAQLNGNPFMGCSNLAELVNNSPNLKQVDRVLYDKDGFTIIYAPASTSGDIVMLDTVREILPGAFAGTKITSVNISDYVEAIPADAFAGCTELKTVKISGNVKTIGDRAFDGCEKLESLFIPKSVEAIGDAAFRGCASMSNPVFEERNTEFTLGVSVFENCASITAVDLPSFIEKLPDYAFAGTGITELVIPESVTDLSGTGVFMNCTQLKSVVWHDGIYGALGSRLFMNTAIESIEIPAGITDLGTNAIAEGKWGPYRGETFKDCKNLTSVTFAEDSEIFSIEGWTFAGCEKLTTIELPNYEMWLADYCFAGSYFEELTIPSTYEFYNAFGYYEGEDTDRNDYCPTIKKLTITVGTMYWGNCDGMPNLEEYHIYEIYDGFWAGDCDGFFYQFDENTTVYLYDTYLTVEECYDNWFFDTSGGVIIYVDGENYTEWEAENG